MFFINEIEVLREAITVTECVTRPLGDVAAGWSGHSEVTDGPFYHDFTSAHGFKKSGLTWWNRPNSERCIQGSWQLFLEVRNFPSAWLPYKGILISELQVGMLWARDWCCVYVSHWSSELLSGKKHLCHRNLQPNVTLILKCLMHGENMTDLDNEKVINVEQYYPELYQPQPANLLRCQTKTNKTKTNPKTMRFITLLQELHYTTQPHWINKISRDRQNS